MNILSFLIVGAALLLQGCSYAISPEVVRTADRAIPFDKFQAEPASYKGKTVIFGGLIVETRDQKNGTLIEIDQKELDYWGKPRRTGRIGGRFVVLQPRRLDALVYSPGREITVAGVVAGTEEGAHPLIHAREVKLWPREKPARENPTFLDPLHDPDTPQGKFGY